MARTLTITLPEALEQALTQTAAQSNQSAEDLIVQLFTQRLIPTDPLMALFGSIQSNIPDLVDRHDDYIGENLYAEMHPDE